MHVSLTEDAGSRTCRTAVERTIAGWQRDGLADLAARISRAERACDANLPGGALGDAAFEAADGLIDALRAALFAAMVGDREKVLPTRSADGLPVIDRAA